jgi:hypothetical protein
MTPEDYMKAARGLPAHVAVRITNRYTPGVDFAGCSKGEIAESVFGKNRDAARWSTPRHKEQLLAALRAEPRPETRTARKAREAAEQAARVAAEDQELAAYFARGVGGRLTLDDLKTEVEAAEAQARHYERRARQLTRLLLIAYKRDEQQRLLEGLAR